MRKAWLLGGASALPFFRRLEAAGFCSIDGEGDAAGGGGGGGGAADGGGGGADDGGQGGGDQGGGGSSGSDDPNKGGKGNPDAGGKKAQPGLLDKATPKPGDNVDKGSGGSDDPNKGQPVITKAPDWVPQKFRAADGSINAAAAAKAAVDAEKIISTGGGKPPATAADYKFEVTSEALKAEGITAFDGNDAVFGVFTKAAHEAKLTNSQANIIANAIMEHAAASGEGIDPEIIVNREFKAMGPNAQKIVDGLKGWGDKLVQDGVLAEGDLLEYKFMAGSAAGARIMVKLRELAGEQPLPMLDNQGGEGGVSEDEAYAMMGEKTADGKAYRYDVDPTFKNKVDGIFKKIYGEEQAGSSVAGRGVRPLRSA